LYYSQSPASYAEISSFTSDTASGVLGQGGPETSMDPQTINESSLAAHNPVSTDYVEKNSQSRYEVTEYVVQEGDALSFIASDFGVSMNSIIWANNLRDADSISPDQVLKIPPVSGVIHPVKSGDTVSTIAKKYGVEEAKIIEFNSLPQDGQLSLGDDIIIPDGQMPEVRIAAVPRSGSVLPRQTSFSYLPNLGDFFMLPASGYNWGKIHGRNGVDIASSCGSPIFAAADGTVLSADAVGYNGGFGKYLKITHPNGTETLYAHASKILVSDGESVAKGQKIALMGTTGRSTGCHLHFEVHGARNPLAKY
jgi:LysM repeat protein